MSSKYLFIGDVHATTEELDDCRNLLDLIDDTARATKATPVFLGDQYNTHNIVRVEVMWFWRHAFSRLREYDPIALVGNHDFAGEGLPMHAMAAHAEQACVVESPRVFDGVLFLPYYSSRSGFVAACNEYADCPTVVCHQTFDGAKYENGFYTEDGVDPELIPQTTVLCGHIHTPQCFGKVEYLGAPRWRTLADADVERGIWLFEFDGGRPVSRSKFDTGEVCRQIKYRLDTPDDPIRGDLDPRHDWRVDIRGPAEWVDRRKAELAGNGVRMRTFKSRTNTPKVRESQGIETAFQSFLGSYNPRFGTDRAQLATMAKDRLHV